MYLYRCFFMHSKTIIVNVYLDKRYKRTVNNNTKIICVPWLQISDKKLEVEYIFKWNLYRNGELKIRKA